MCKNYDIEIPQQKKRKVSTKIDCSSSTQYYMSSKEEEMKVSVYYSTLDHMISGINIRFNQETINMIRSIGNYFKYK